MIISEAKKMQISDAAMLDMMARLFAQRIGRRMAMSVVVMVDEAGKVHLGVHGADDHLRETARRIGADLSRQTAALFELERDEAGKVVPL